MPNVAGVMKKDFEDAKLRKLNNTIDRLIRMNTELVEAGTVLMNDYKNDRILNMRISIGFDRLVKAIASATEEQSK